MKALLLPLAAVALAGCASYGDPYGYGYPASTYPTYPNAYPTTAYPGGAVYPGTVHPGATVYQGTPGTVYSAPYGTYGYPQGGAVRGQRDRDGDGIPNRLDPDRDGDGVPNEQDAYPNNPRRR